MGYAELTRIAREWEEMIHIVLDLERFSFVEMQELLKETYIVLIAFHKEQFIPKGISKILLNMDSFLYFVSLIEGQEVAIGFYHYQALSAVVNALKKGFFESNYKYTYPKLQICDMEQKTYIVDLESGNLADFL